MIEFKSIEKKYQNDFWTKSFKALDDLSFKIERGALVGFLGANGAGKTTSIKIMLKFIKQEQGEIIYGPELGADAKSIFSRIGYIPERPYFYPHLTGKEFLEYMGRLSDVPKNLIAERMRNWGERFGIAFALDRKVRSYSKGMLQRLGFVASLIHDPILLILDEPLSGLDPIGRRELKQALVELYREGKTVFFSSHIVSDVEEICNKVVFLEKGRLVYDGSIDQLIEKNVKPRYAITFYDNAQPLLRDRLLHRTNEGICTLQVNEEEKDQVVREIMNARANLLSLNSLRPTLEEIIYKIRS